MRATDGEASVEAAIRAPHVALVPLALDYAPALFELLNDWEVVRMLSEVAWPLGYDDVATFLATKHSASNSFVLVAEAGPIGTAAVKKPGSGTPPRQMPRLGYWIGQRYWRRGYGTEAIGALVDFAFATYAHDHVGAGVFHDNVGSRKLLEKLGFTAVGRKTTDSRSRGPAVATVEMLVTRADWTTVRARR